jgi:hypothetical protein
MAEDLSMADLMLEAKFLSLEAFSKTGTRPKTASKCG